ncbi:MAG: SelT/SelW/SelH family protein [Chloroflexi bacterium]|nr:SelT/SelW/SelH family protein [Chloroflexota bacterium]
MLLKEFNRKLNGVKLAPGPKGAFEVSINGRNIFSKHQLGRFPDNKEVRESVKQALAAPSS